MVIDFLNVIKTRRSCRKYSDEQIGDADLQLVLEAGTWAPTARGLQDPLIVAVQSPTLIAKLSAMNAVVMGVKTDPYYGAPTIILVFASESNHNAIQDGSCVLQNIMLAAHAIGLSTCWINREMEMFATPEGKALLAEMGLPSDIMGIGALSIGYADGPLREAKPRKEGYARVIK